MKFMLFSNHCVKPCFSSGCYEVIYLQRLAKGTLCFYTRPQRAIALVEPRENTDCHRRALNFLNHFLCSIQCPLQHNRNDDVFVGAPTNSGKTICAEFAVLCLFSASPDSRCVFSLPSRLLLSRSVCPSVCPTLVSKYPYSTCMWLVERKPGTSCILELALEIIIAPFHLATEQISKQSVHVAEIQLEMHTHTQNCFSSLKAKSRPTRTTGTAHPGWC